jgi:WD40 repeat protein
MRLGTLLKLTLASVALAAWFLVTASLWWFPRIPLRATLAGTAPSALLAFSPSGDTLALTSSDNSSLSLWDVNEVTKLEEIVSDDADRAVFSPDSQLLAVPQSHGELVFWDVATRRPRLTLHEPVGRFCFSPDGALLAGCLEPSGELGVWEVDSGKQLTILPGCSWFQFDASGRHLVHETAEKTLLWNLKDERDDASLEGIVRAFSPSGDRVALASDSTVRVYETQSAHEVAVLDISHAEDLALASDNRTLAVLQSGRIALWDLDDLGPKCAFENSGCEGPMFFSPDGSLLAIKSFLSSQTSGLWNTRANPPRLVFVGLFTGSSAFLKRGTIREMAFSPDGKTVVIHGMHPPASNDLRTKLKRWLQRNQTVQTLGELKLVETSSCQVYASVNDCATWLLSPDGMALATKGYDDENVKLWTVPRRTPFVQRLLYTWGPPILLLAAWLALRLRTQHSRT